MGYTVPAGSVVAVAPLGGEPAVGEIVAYRQRLAGRVIVHRVVGRDADGMRTRGDANASPDPFVVSEDDLLGRVVWASPLLGRLARLLRG